MWDNSLKNVSNETIKQALDVLHERFPSWPPTPGEFYEMCLSIRGSDRFKFKDSSNVAENLKISHNQSGCDIGHMIKEGAKVCSMLKEIYPIDNWFCIADKFSELKKIIKSYYPKLKGVEIIKKIMTFETLEIKEMLIAEKIK
jgi:hypothetical protein